MVAVKYRHLTFLGMLMTYFCFALADMYLHNPRGSNNRLDEAGRERQNGKRLFDSQNNNRGGYNVGSLYYYEGSILSIEWTNQHSCNDANNHCDVILQYMCHDNLRDGVTTSTIPNGPINCAKFECSTDTRYGMHEGYMYYQQCKLRERNQGLFTADQNLRSSHRRSARNTRQNPQGTRYGYECPEERDYYPYWHPTPWRDISVLTNNASRCVHYQTESENVKSRHYCHFPSNVLMAMMSNNEQGIIPNNEIDCESFQYPKNDPNATVGVWLESPSHNIDPPECRESEYSRDNHLGNGVDGYPLVYNWTIPGHIVHEQCVLRIRYNISTGDFSSTVNASYNPTIDLSPTYGLNTSADRGYTHKGNPQIQIFSGYPNIKLRLAIDTAQYGRTFQDRSHRFGIRPRPVSITDQKQIYNVNVRGKRGNIVQVYPAVEYDFVPNTLQIPQEHYIHIQWTGSNTNPGNNDGQGQAGSDRSNIILQRPVSSQWSVPGSGSLYGAWSVSYPEHVSNITYLGLDLDDIITLATLTHGQYGGEMSELDDAGTYFDLSPPRRVTLPEPYQSPASATHHYMCTRNNNFSNRSQKGRIIITSHRSTTVSVGWNGANVTVPDSATTLYIDRGVFTSLHKLQVEELSKEEGRATLEQHAAENTAGAGEEFVSNFIIIHPQELDIADGKYVRIELSVDSSPSDVGIYRSSTPSFSTWSRLEVDEASQSSDEHRISFLTSRGGVYVARRSRTSIGTIVALVLTAVVLLALVLASVIYFRRHPDKWDELRDRGRRVHRSVKARV